mmetsp:Transcript_25204/g.76493  ORF Transcript_25204/g.76493 Transcript_25204/m.76493 type:complete len:86 (+) Transcript_25204:194-451(+)
MHRGMVRLTLAIARCFLLTITYVQGGAVLHARTPLLPSKPCQCKNGTGSHAPAQSQSGRGASESASPKATPIELQGAALRRSRRP